MKLSRKRGLKKRRNKKFSRKRRVQSGGFVGTFYNLAMMPLKIAGNVMNSVFTGVKTLTDKQNNNTQNNSQGQAPMNNVVPMNNVAPMNNVVPMNSNNNNGIMIDNNTKSIIESNNNNIDTLKKMIKLKQMINSVGENMDIIHPIQSLQVVKLH